MKLFLQSPYTVTLGSGSGESNSLVLCDVRDSIRMVLDSQAPLPVQRYQDRGDLILFATKAPCDPEWKDDQLDASKGEYRPLKVNSLILGRIARSGTGSGYLSQICPLYPDLSEEEVSSFKDNTSLSSVLKRLSSLYCTDHPESELYLFLGTEAVLQELYVF